MSEWNSSLGPEYLMYVEQMWREDEIRVAKERLRLIEAQYEQLAAIWRSPPLTYSPLT